ncbi:hypothetical protein [Bdellovibrio sp. HCB2-146]|uniref:hypothetical protein n=1 Tax=Bdellovibrio sp. HCB2-146 TaxID=3394362 RepID=UPI0039BC6EAC
MKYIIVVLMIFSVHAEAKKRRRSRDRERPPAPSFPAEQMKSLKKDGVEYSLKTTKTNCEGSTEKFCLLKLQMISKEDSAEKNKWETDLYIKDLNPNLAVENQEIKVESFAFAKGDTVSVVDERGVKYVVEAGTGALQKPARAIVYPASGTPTTSIAAPTAATAPAAPPATSGATIAPAPAPSPAAN